MSRFDLGLHIVERGRIVRRKSAWVALLATALVTAGVSAHAQAPTEPTSGRWDATVAVGLFSGHPEDVGQNLQYDDWYHEPAASVVIGRYWTTHVKTEHGFSYAGEGRTFATYLSSIDGVPWPVPISTFEYRQMTSVTAAAVWQFFENQWVHPFVEGGLGLDLERLRTDAPRQEIWVGRSAQDPGRLVEVSEERHTRPVTTGSVRWFVGTGAKLYVSARAFVRVDMRGTARQRLDSMVYRLGVGIDF